MLKEKVRGPVVVMITPFDKNMQLDEEGLQQNTQYLIKGGIVEGAGVLLPGGSTGECSTLSLEERKRIIQIVCEEAKDKVPVVAGCNCIDPRTVVELAEHAKKCGAAGIMVIPPYYWTPLESQIVAFYEYIAERTSIEIMVYNNSTVTGVDMPLRVLERLASIKTVTSLKECTPSLNKLNQVIEMLKDRLAIVSGSESNEPYGSMMGAPAYISGIGNFAPSLTAELNKAVQKGDFGKANEIHKKELELYKVMWKVTARQAGGQVTLFKECMNLLGLPGGQVRPPLLPLTSEEMDDLAAALGRMGFKVKR